MSNTLSQLAQFINFGGITYLIYDLTNSKTLDSRDIRFHKDYFPFAHTLLDPLLLSCLVPLIFLKILMLFLVTLKVTHLFFPRPSPNDLLGCSDNYLPLRFSHGTNPTFSIHPLIRVDDGTFSREIGSFPVEINWRGVDSLKMRGKIVQKNDNFAPPL